MSDSTSITSESKEETMLKTTTEDAKSKIIERIKIGHELKQLDVSTSEQFDHIALELKKWHHYNSLLLKQMFTTDEISNFYDNCDAEVLVQNIGRIDLRAKRVKDQLKIHIDRLEVIINNLSLYKIAKNGEINKSYVPRIFFKKIELKILFNKIINWLENHTGQIIAAVITTVLTGWVAWKLGIKK